jgi:hypothetical protein
MCDCLTVKMLSNHLHPGKASHVDHAISEALLDWLSRLKQNPEEKLQRFVVQAFNDLDSE